MKHSFVRLAVVIAGLILASNVHGLRSVADTTWSALPSAGGSQAYAASQQFNAPGGMMPPGGMNAGKISLHNQSGTLTVARAAADSVHLSATDGLDAFDQTLHVDAQGTIAQSSPANPFIDTLDTVSAMLAAAPANPQKDASWKINITTPSWLNSYFGGKMPKEFASIPVTVTVASADGSSVRLHGTGGAEQQMKTGMGTQTVTLTLTADCTLKSGQVKSISRTTNFDMAFGSMSSGLGETTSLASK